MIRPTGVLRESFTGPGTSSLLLPENCPIISITFLDEREGVELLGVALMSPSLLGKCFELVGSSGLVVGVASVMDLDSDPATDLVGVVVSLVGVASV